MRGNYLAIVAVVAALGIGGYFVMKPRGVRNRNVLNIEYKPENQWLGQTGSDGRYATFSAHPDGEFVYGLRAGARLLKNYSTRYGINTVAGIISRFAPAHENPTDIYIVNVARGLGIPPERTATQQINVSDPATLHALITGMVRQEIGSRYARQVTPNQISRGIALS